ncbi:MAG: hypothetical protein ACRDJP_14685 [Actinomycetota bacterium]
MSERPPPEHESPPDQWWDESDEPEYLVLPDPDPARRTSSPGRSEPSLEAIAGRIERLEGLVDKVTSQVAVARDEIGGFASEIREGLRSLTGGIDTVRTQGAAITGAVDETRRELGVAVETARAEAAAQSAAVQADLEARTTGIRAGLEDVEGSIHQAVRDAADGIGSDLREAVQAVEGAVKEASRVTGEEHASTMDRYAKEFAVALRPLGEGVARIERLASVIEAMGKRRGFRALVRSEETLREEQANFVRALTESSTDVSARVAALTERLGQLDERLERASEDASSLRQLPVHATERVARAVERLRSELTVVLQDRFGEQVQVSVDRLKTELEAGLPVKEAIDRLRDLAGTQSELAAVQKSIDGVVASLRTEVRGLRDRIQSWGKPRTAPRLATEVDQLGNRLDALETEIREGFAERLAQTVTEKVLSALDESEAARGRGLFRRP